MTDVRLGVHRQRPGACSWRRDAPKRIAVHPRLYCRGAKTTSHSLRSLSMKREAR